MTDYADSSTAALSSVFLQETPGRFRAHPVRAVSLDGGRLAVEGLTAGVLVVTRGAYYLRAALQGAPGEG